MGKKVSSTQAGTTAFSQLQAENEALKKEVAELQRKLEHMNELFECTACPVWTVQ